MVATDNRTYCTVAEAARALGVSPSTIWRWIDAGRLPAVRVGPRNIRIAREALDKMVQPARPEADAPKYPWSDRDIPAAWRETLERPLTEEEIERRHKAIQWILSHPFDIAPRTSADLLREARREQRWRHPRD